MERVRVRVAELPLANGSAPIPRLMIGRGRDVGPCYHSPIVAHGWINEWGATRMISASDGLHEMARQCGSAHDLGGLYTYIASAPDGLHEMARRQQHVIISHKEVLSRAELV